MSKLCNLPDHFMEPLKHNIANANINVADSFNKICFIQDNSIIIDYIYFKKLATTTTYNLITTLITNNIDCLLQTVDVLSVHLNMKSLSIIDIDKHLSYIQYLATYLQEKYTNKLDRCHIYNASCIFTNMYKIIKVFIDKETQEKIQLIKPIEKIHLTKQV